MGKQPAALFNLAEYAPPSNRQLSPEATRARSLVGVSAGRPEGDFYPTPPGATQALLRVIPLIVSPIWEPACGDGAMSRVLEAEGFEVISTDLHDRGFGTPGVDFLGCKSLLAPAIITNPPFTLALPFAQHALRLGAEQVALFVKLAFLEGQERTAWLQSSPLKSIFVFRDRVSLYRNGERRKNGGMISFCWFYWEKGYKGPPALGWVASKSLKSS
jgi:hypothetical protein